MTAGEDIHSTYDEALARHYDEDYEILRSDAGDVRFYRELALASGGPVLEVACGTGRVLLPIARAGMTVTGVDPSPTMLDTLRRKLQDEPAAVRERFSLHDGSYASIPLPSAETPGDHEPYALVYSAFRAFQHLITRDEKVAALREMARVLAPHGTLAFDVFDYCPVRAAARVDEHTDYRVDEGGHVLERRSWSQLLPDRALISVIFRWLKDGEETERSAFHMSITRRDEIEGLLAEAGLRLHALHADFEGATWSPDNPRELLILARHA